MLFRNEEAQVAGEQTKVIQLARRSERHMKKLLQLGIAAPAAALRDIGGHGKSRSPHLTRQSKSFVGREWRRSPINTQSQRMPFSPNVQLPKILHCRRPPSRGLTTRIAGTRNKNIRRPFLLFVFTYNSKPMIYNSAAACRSLRLLSLLFVPTYNLKLATCSPIQNKQDFFPFASAYNLKRATYGPIQDKQDFFPFVPTYNLKLITYNSTKSYTQC
jgi:hypothetical protein